MSVQQPKLSVTPEPLAAVDDLKAATRRRDNQHYQAQLDTIEAEKAAIAQELLEVQAKENEKQTQAAQRKNLGIADLNDVRASTGDNDNAKEKTAAEDKASKPVVKSNKKTLSEEEISALKEQGRAVREARHIANAENEKAAAQMDLSERPVVDNVNAQDLLADVHALFDEGEFEGEEPFVKGEPPYDEPSAKEEAGSVPDKVNESSGMSLG